MWKPQGIAHLKALNTSLFDAGKEKQ